MVRYCCVKGCKSTPKKGARLFAVPLGKKVMSIRAKWLKVLGKPDNFVKKLDVCHLHFCENDVDIGYRFSAIKNIKLKRDAIPHLHIKETNAVCMSTGPTTETHPFNFPAYQSLDSLINPGPSADTSQDICASFSDNISIVNEDSSVNMPSYHSSISPVPVENCSLTDTEQNLSRQSATFPNDPFVDIPNTNIPIPVENSSFTYNERNLYEQNVRLRKENKELLEQIRILQERNKIVEKENQNLKKDNNEATLDRLSSFLNPDQIVCLSQNTMRGFQWTNETLMKAYKLRLACGSTGYELLRSLGQPLPGQRTLNKRIEHLKFSPGLLNEVLTALKIKVDLMSEEEKHCTILLDELAISPTFDYDPSTGLVLGKPTVPSSNDDFEERASHGLVYMLAGVTSRWKQVVGYQLTGRSFNASYVRDDIFNIIYEAENMGLKVDIVVNDMAGQNQAIWRLFNIHAHRHSQVRGHIVHPCDNSRKLYFSPDPPHVLKHIRDHMTNGQIIYLPQFVVDKNKLPTNEVRIEHIKRLLEIDNENELKLCPYLNEACVKPSHFEKMKVGLAVRLIHHDTGAGLRYSIDKGLLDRAALTTAWFCETIYQWFKLISSRERTLAFSNAGPVYKQVVVFLKEVIEMFNGIQIGPKNIWKPVQTGVVLATTNAIELGDYYLKEKGFHYVCLGRFSQDALENLFSQIRYINPVPSPKYFKMALRLISVAQFLKPNRRGSYDIDDAKYLADFLNDTKEIELTEEEPEEEELELDYVEDIGMDEAQSLYYIAGRTVHVVVKKNKLTCSMCLGSIKTKCDDPSVEGLKFLTELKAISPKIIFATREVYELLENAESHFRKFETCLINGETKMKFVTANFLRHMESSLPNCHNIAEKIVKTFYTARIYFLLRRANARTNKENGPLRCESRSLGMRRAIKNVY